MEVVIRDFEKPEDYEACAELQMEVWGFSAADAVPALHLIAMHHFGGICIGGFQADRMVGFVCGFSGFLNGRIFHHSHMLGVLQEFRGSRLGEKLKWAQRDRALASGIELVNWTFDPLQAPNANLNINRLGAIVRKYRVNLYGESRSPLHGNMPTDRFEAEWLLPTERVARAREGVYEDWGEWESLPRANRTLRRGDFRVCDDAISLELTDDIVLIELPRTINDVMAADAGLALDWRLKLRMLCQAYLSRSYTLLAVHRKDKSAFYRLEREDVPGA